MAFSYNEVGPVDPGFTTVSLTFPFLERIHVKVSVDKIVLPDSAWAWNSDTQIELNDPLVGGEVVKVFRTTPAAGVQADFKPGAFDYEELNTSLLHLLYIVQEAYDNSSVAVEAGNNALAYLMQIEDIMDDVTILYADMQALYTGYDNQADAALAALASALSAALSAISSARSGALSDISSARTSALNAISTSLTAALDVIANARAAATSAMDALVAQTQSLRNEAEGFKNSAAVSSANASGLSGFRNKLINGDFDLWQRAASFSGAGYTADRWLIGADGSGSGRSGVVSQAVDEAANVLIGGGGGFHLRWSESAAGAGYGFKVLEQRIEGVRNLAGRQATVTFWACMPIGGGSARVVQLRQYYGVGGSGFVDTGVNVTIPNDGVWRKYSVLLTLPSTAGKTVGAGHYLSLMFYMPPNIPFLFGIKRVSVVEGDATAEADPFAPRHIQQELALCQRYYQRVVGYRRWTGGAAAIDETKIWFMTQMRAGPTVTQSQGAAVNITASTTPTVGIDGLRWLLESTAAGDAYYLSRLFECEAEL